MGEEKGTVGRISPSSTLLQTRHVLAKLFLQPQGRPPLSQLLAHLCIGHLLSAYCVPGPGGTETLSALRSHSLTKVASQCNSQDRWSGPEGHPSTGRPQTRSTGFESWASLLPHLPIGWRIMKIRVKSLQKFQCKETSHQLFLEKKEEKPFNSENFVFFFHFMFSKVLFIKCERRMLSSFKL